MASTTIVPISQYKTKNESYSHTDGNWGNWSNTTDQSTNDKDNNRFYLGRFTYSSYDTSTYYHWICRLYFTVPTTITISQTNKLVVALKARSKYYLTYPKVILSDTNYKPNPNNILGGTASHISTSYIYSDTNKTAIGGQNIASGTTVYLVFDTFSKNLVPGSTYYLYFIPYRYSSRSSVDFQSSGFSGSNLPGYTTVTLEYESGAVWIYTGSGTNGWQQAIPYIYTGSGPVNGWQQTVPYVYTGSGGTNGWNISS